MRSITLRFRVLVGVATAAASLAAGCGSPTPASPSAPSPVGGQISQYPSIIGQWGGSAGLAIQYHGPDVSSSSHCDASLTIREQKDGTFSGSGGLNGSSLNSDKQCPGAFAFTAVMTVNGLITSFRPDQRFNTEECRATSDVSFSSGTASSAGFRIEMTDRAMCRWPPFGVLNPFASDTNRTWTMTVDLRRTSVSP